MQDEATASLDLDSVNFRSRILKVSLATANPVAKRSATLHGSRTQASTSPQPEHSHGHHSTRTIALLNLADTVNASRLHALAEPHGTVVKVYLRPQSAGALIEYASVADAGKAALALDGVEMDGRKVRVGEAGELRGNRPDREDDGDVKRDAKGDGKKGGNDTKGKMAAPTMVPKRAGLGFASRGGGRGGGLGKKMGGRGGIGMGAGRGKVNGDGDGAQEGANGTSAGAKSNADFKAMFVPASKSEAGKK